jgi:NDP-sugar pyrophosphorylase family protein
MKTTLIIMAAGMGSRYGGLKQMDSLGPNGETLIEYAVFDAIKAGFSNIIFVIRRDFETEFKQQIGSRFETRVQIDYAFQELDSLPAGYALPEGRTKPWGTAHAILTCQHLVSGPCAVQNADDFYGAPAYQTIHSALLTLQDQQSCMVGYSLHNTLSDHGHVSRGICQLENGHLKNITERTHIQRQANNQIVYLENDQPHPLPQEAICSMNFWGFSVAFVQQLENQFIQFLDRAENPLTAEWYIPTVVANQMAAHQTHVQVLTCDSPWFGITYADDKPYVQQALKRLHQAGQYPDRLF